MGEQFARIFHQAHGVSFECSWLSNFTTLRGKMCNTFHRLHSLFFRHTGYSPSKLIERHLKILRKQGLLSPVRSISTAGVVIYKVRTS